MTNKKTSKIHFMGIGGSACAGVALLAKNAGFEVTGCDIAEDTPYLKKVKEAGIQTFVGHDKSHLEKIDIVSISPAIEYQSKDNPEYLEAKQLGIIEIWDKFVGDYLLEGKESICITGTHGKSTTSSLAALVFEKAGLDPSAIIGAKVKVWEATHRVGSSKYFVIEADDFYEKFLSYKPSTIIINNIEYDHPEFFKSENNMVDSYFKFVNLLSGSKNLIFNQDSEGNKKLYDKLDKEFLKSIHVYGYTFNNEPRLKIENSVKIEIKNSDEQGTHFELNSEHFHLNDIYNLSIPGEFNVANATGVIILSKLYDINQSVVKEALKDFDGTGRRLDLIGEKRGVKVYDDYAHHPTAIKATIEAIKQKYPDSRIWAIDEPHSYSRTKALLSEYIGVFDSADKVIIAPIFKARDTETFGITENDLVKATVHNNIVYLDEFEKITKLVSEEAKEGDVILVMGAGKSYQLARDILTNL